MHVTALFVAALGWEARQLLRGLAVSQPRRRGAATLWTAGCALGDVAVLQTGIGAEHADAGLRFAAELVTPDVVLSTGCAGALDPVLGTGDLVIASEIVGPSGERIATAARWRDRYQRAGQRAGVRTTIGPLLSSDAVLLDPAAKHARAAESGAIAVEMEAFALARVADGIGVEFAAARVILDPAGVTLPADVVRAADAHGRTSPARVLSAVVRRPAVIPELVALGSMAARCRKALAAVHRALLVHPVDDPPS